MPRNAFVMWWTAPMHRCSPGAPGTGSPSGCTSASRAVPDPSSPEPRPGQRCSQRTTLCPPNPCPCGPRSPGAPPSSPGPPRLPPSFATVPAPPAAAPAAPAPRARPPSSTAAGRPARGDEAGRASRSTRRRSRPPPPLQPCAPRRCRGPSARWDHALPLGSHRSQRLRLLRPGLLGLPELGCVAAAHEPRHVTRRHPGVQGRTAPR